jgi:hypothetical protein
LNEEARSPSLILATTRYRSPGGFFDPDMIDLAVTRHETLIPDDTRLTPN